MPETPIAANPPLATVPAGALTRESCQARDDADPLGPCRASFTLPDGVVYLDGNSLGPLPKVALERAREVVEVEWGRDLIASWNTHEWFDLPQRLGRKLAQLLGGTAGGCVVSDSTSINVFQAVSAALELQREHPERRVIVSERQNFPTDLYIIEGIIELLDRNIELRLIDDADQLKAALGPDVAVVLLTEVNYRTGALWGMAETTAWVHAAGALVVWDLCHSAGAVPIALDAAGADFAVGCTYKYLNGGPGAPGFVWVAARHLERARNVLSGWWGHARPFAMETSYDPAPGIARFQVGTQPILSMSVCEVGVDLALEVDIHAVRAKSLQLTDLCIALLETRLAAFDLTLVTPRAHASRGSQVSVVHPEGYAVMQALIAAGVIGDYREPGVLRFGFTPLYTSFTDVWDAMETLREVLATERFRDPEFQRRGAVT